MSDLHEPSEYLWEDAGLGGDRWVSFEVSVEVGLVGPVHSGEADVELLQHTDRQTDIGRYSSVRVWLT